MKSTQNIIGNKPALGMNKDFSKNQMSDGEYVHARNAVISNQTGDLTNIQNAPSTLDCLELDKQLIGSTYIKENKTHIIFLYSENGEHEIALVEDCLKETQLLLPCLNFNINYPIKSVYRYDLNGNLIVYFQDGFNPDRRINLNNLPYKRVLNEETGCFEDTDIIDCNAINIVNDFLIPIVRPKAITEGGNLRSGTVQAKIAYCDAAGNEITPYYSLTNAIPIFTDSIQGYEQTEGSRPDAVTSKSVIFEFSNIDSKYAFISLAIITTVLGKATYSKVILNSSQKEYVLTSNSPGLPLLPEVIDNPNSFYTKSKTLTTANNYLIRANLEDELQVNWQWLANRIKLNWAITKRQGENSTTTYKNPLEQEATTGYMRGEVYGFAIQFLLKNGLKTRAFHIPGRKATASDLELITDTCDRFDIITQNQCDPEVASIPKWKARDTASITELDINKDVCEGEIVGYGEFAYWESTDRYPCLDFYEENKSQPIRHHKFPSNETIHIHDLTTTGNKSLSSVLNSAVTSDSLKRDMDKRTFIYPIGIQLEKKLEQYLADLKAVLNGTNTDPLNPYIGITISPDESNKLLGQIDNIVGYEIARTTRDSNRSIVAKGLLYNTRNYLEQAVGLPNQEVAYPNYPYNPEGIDYYHNVTSVVTQTFTENITGPFVAGTYDSTTPGLFTLLGTEPALSSVIVDITAGIETLLNTDYNITDPIIVEYKLYTISGITIAEVCFRFEQDESTLSELDSTDLSSYCLATQDIIGTLAGFMLLFNAQQQNVLKDAFTFHSPDIHFNRPFLGQELRTHTIEYGASRGWFSNVEFHPQLKPVRTGGDFMNHAAQYKSVGEYNNSVSDPTFVNRRFLIDRFYLPNNSVSRSSPANELIINNRFRESSVFLRTANACTIPLISEAVNALDPTKTSRITDNSLLTIRSANAWNNIAIKLSRKPPGRRGYKVDQGFSFYRRISSYYASIHNPISNQYGQLETTAYISTGKTFLIGSEPDNPYVFGGDTFINKFALKRKVSFFSVSYLNDEPAGINYEENGVIPSPRYYLINDKIGGAGEFKPDKSSNFDGGTTGVPFFGNNQITPLNGFFYLYNYGIPYFFVESEINTDLRYSGLNENESFYPVLKKTTLNRFMEQQYSPIELDNFYLYDRTYNKQSVEEAFLPLAPGTFEGLNTYPRKIIYSVRTDSQSITDGWIINLPENQYNSEDRLGDIVDIQAIDNFRVLVRYQNGIQLFNAYDTLQLDQTIVTLGNGGMFQQRPKTFAETDIGYGGTKSKFAIDVTQFGTFVIDEENKKVFVLSSQLTELSRNKMTSWFNENMNLKFKEFLSTIPRDNSEKFNLDNPYNGIGYTSVFDSKYDIWFLTKLDKLPPEGLNTNLISFTESGEMLYNGDPVDFKTWDDYSWTIGYSPLTERWISFYDFKPWFYLDGKQEFYSGVSNIYKHWDEKTFQTYYGNYFPFELTSVNKEPLVNTLHTIEYDMRTIEYITQETYKYVESNFSHMYVNTDRQTTGLLTLQLQNKSDLRNLVNNATVLPNTVVIPYSKLEGNKFRVNVFRDITDDPTQAILIEEGDRRIPVNYNTQKINNLVLGNQKLRNEWFETTFIKNDPTKSNHKLIFNLAMNKINKSIR